MKRCPTCNNRKLTHCKGEIKSCECNCTKYTDNIINRIDPEHDTTHDDYYKNLNKRWRELQDNEPKVQTAEVPK